MPTKRIIAFVLIYFMGRIAMSANDAKNRHHDDVDGHRIATLRQ